MEKAVSDKKMTRNMKKNFKCRQRKAYSKYNLEGKAVPERLRLEEHRSHLPERFTGYRPRVDYNLAQLIRQVKSSMSFGGKNDGREGLLVKASTPVLPSTGDDPLKSKTLIPSLASVDNETATSILRQRNWSETAAGIYANCVAKFGMASEYNPSDPGIFEISDSAVTATTSCISAGQEWSDRAAQIYLELTTDMGIECEYDPHNADVHPKTQRQKNGTAKYMEEMWSKPMIAERKTKKIRDPFRDTTAKGGVPKPAAIAAFEPIAIQYNRSELISSRDESRHELIDKKFGGEIKEIEKRFREKWGMIYTVSSGSKSIFVPKVPFEDEFGKMIQVQRSAKKDKM